MDKQMGIILNDIDNELETEFTLRIDKSDINTENEVHEIYIYSFCDLKENCCEITYEIKKENLEEFGNFLIEAGNFIKSRK